MARHINLQPSSLLNYVYILYRCATSGWYRFLTLCMPDIFLLENDNTDTRHICETMFHELSHASHYTQAGKLYWRQYVTHILTNRGYGAGDEVFAGFAGVGEIWGNFHGAEIARQRFGNLNPVFRYFEDWYNPGYYMELHDIEHLNERQLFMCLQPNINTFNLLHNELNRRYPSSRIRIDSLFTVYFP